MFNYPEMQGVGATHDASAWRKPMPTVPPADYVPTTPYTYDTAPESKLGLYIGLGIAAVVVAGGVFLFVTRD